MGPGMSCAPGMPAPPPPPPPPPMPGTGQFHDQNTDRDIFHEVQQSENTDAISTLLPHLSTLNIFNNTNIFLYPSFCL